MRVFFAEPLQHHRSHFRVSLIGLFFSRFLHQTLDADDPETILSDPDLRDAL